MGNLSKKTERHSPQEGSAETLPFQVGSPDKVQDTCTVWDMLTPKSYSLSI